MSINVSIYELSLKMIYIVTTLFINEKEGQVVRSRAWGYFFDEEKAKDIVIKNSTDIFEAGFYNFAVVEKVNEGVFGKCEKAGWYKAEYIAEQAGPIVKKIKEPAFLKRYIRFWAG